MEENNIGYSQLTDKQCREARYARDSRFDGVFFVAVKTTGIFCRPICPANPPKEPNVEYFANASLALNAGYRPCLRCRPDSAPASPAWMGVETTFVRAVKLIDEGALSSGSIVTLAERLGISERYLRSLFDRYMGVSPKQYALHSQLMFAKHLLHSSRMSITDIGYASGFNSTRRFNDAFIKVMRLSPRQLRKSSEDKQAENHVQLTFRPPFDWQYMLDFYRCRAIEGVEEIGNNAYQRHIVINGSKAWFRAQRTKANMLDIEFELEDPKQLRHLITQIRRMFDLDVDIAKVEAFLGHSCSTLVKHSGIRIPGVWSPWEAGVRAILGQQVSVKAAIGQLNLLVATLSDSENQHSYFPSASQVATADLSFLRMPSARKETLKRFAQFMENNSQQHPSQWIEIKGIGPWTIQYALLRGLSEPDHLLVGDLVVKRFIEQHPEITKESVSPWGSYATFHCWQQSI